jgi:hypothetical protein
MIRSASPNLNRAKPNNLPKASKASAHRRFRLLESSEIFCPVSTQHIYCYIHLTRIDGIQHENTKTYSLINLFARFIRFSLCFGIQDLKYTQTIIHVTQCYTVKSSKYKLQIFQHEFNGPQLTNSLPLTVDQL